MGVSAWFGVCRKVSLRHLLYITLAGGACGALLLLQTSTHAFDQMLPWLLLIATVALAFGNSIGEALRRYCRVHPSFVLAIQFALGIYGGYFGGGVGLMMLAMWGLLEKRDLKSLNASLVLLSRHRQHDGGADLCCGPSRVLARRPPCCWPRRWAAIAVL